ncbi:putative serine/threonine-protein kinase isoform X1 [Vespula maculifrons]|uniref:Serine/threonine-protein kinase isoform X1 n=1 Tax=Vespula maculifrons TaxID=7453 RepID=A0ABD2CME5_VESMC
MNCLNVQGAEEDQDWKSKDDELRLNQLRQRRGRSIVHRSLEDNYGAVVVANHEALAQFVEQVNQVTQVPVSLRALKNSNPRLRDFTIDTNTSVFIGRRIFCSASWNEQNVSLCIAFDQAMHVSRKEFYLVPIIEFIETVPKEISERVSLSVGKDMEDILTDNVINSLTAAISVFPRLQVSTVQAFGLATKDSQDEGATRESSFVLLQFVNALKSLQARGIEESSKSLSNVMLCREDKDVCYRLYLLQGSLLLNDLLRRLNVDTCDVRREEKVSLCQCALVALQQLHLTKRLPLVQELLLREKAVTLSQVKSLLEFTLWGPADVTLGGPREREVALQRWLDLERATILHALVRTRAPLTITDEYQLLFLVRTSAKTMCEASILLDEQRNRLSRVC